VATKKIEIETEVGEREASAKAYLDGKVVGHVFLGLPLGIPDRCADGVEELRGQGYEGTFWTVENAHILLPYRGKGGGKKLYKAAFDAIVADRGGPILVGPDLCNRLGETTGDAMRVWESLYRGYPHSGGSDVGRGRIARVIVVGAQGTMSTKSNPKRRSKKRKSPPAKRRVKNPTFDFGDGNGAVPAGQHTNPDGSTGGWVADTALVAGTAHLDDTAIVHGAARVSQDAQVLHGSRVFGNAIVRGSSILRDQSFVSGTAQVLGGELLGHSNVEGAATVSGDVVLMDAVVRDNARISQNAVITAGTAEGAVHISGNAKIFNATVSGHARVGGDAKVTDDAVVRGSSTVYGDAAVSGRAVVDGQAQISGSAQVGENASVAGSAIVRGKAHIMGSAKVSGNARIEDRAAASGDAEVGQDAHLKDDAWVYHNAVIRGTAIIGGDAEIETGTYTSGAFFDAADVAAAASRPSRAKPMKKPHPSHPMSGASPSPRAAATVPELPMEGAGDISGDVAMAEFIQRGLGPRPATPEVQEFVSEPERQKDIFASMRKHMQSEVLDNPKNLVERSQRLWDAYYERPTKKNLLAFAKHLTKMAPTRSSRVKSERARGLRAFNREWKAAGYKGSTPLQASAKKASTPRRRERHSNGSARAVSAKPRKSKRRKNPIEDLEVIEERADFVRYRGKSRGFTYEIYHDVDHGYFEYAVTEGPTLTEAELVLGTLESGMPLDTLMEADDAARQAIVDGIAAAKTVKYD